MIKITELIKKWSVNFLVMDESTHLFLDSKSGAGKYDGTALCYLSTTARGAGQELELLCCVELLSVGLYIPKKKDDKLCVTGSPQAALFGFCSSRGPERPITRAPIGAVIRMDSTATVSTSMPYF